jgi:hypothetical protein
VDSGVYDFGVLLMEDNWSPAPALSDNLNLNCGARALYGQTQNRLTRNPQDPTLPAALRHFRSLKYISSTSQAATARFPSTPLSFKQSTMKRLLLVVVSFLLAVPQSVVGICSYTWYEIVSQSSEKSDVLESKAIGSRCVVR